MIAEAVMGLGAWAWIILGVLLIGVELVASGTGEPGGAVPVLDLDDVDPGLRPGEVSAAAGAAAWNSSTKSLTRERA